MICTLNTEHTLRGTQGYNNVEWDDACIRQVAVEGRVVHFLNVALTCDIALTPWCQVLEQ